MSVCVEFVFSTAVEFRWSDEPAGYTANAPFYLHVM